MKNHIKVLAPILIKAKIIPTVIIIIHSFAISVSLNCCKSPILRLHHLLFHFPNLVQFLLPCFLVFLLCFLYFFLMKGKSIFFLISFLISSGRFFLIFLIFNSENNQIMKIIKAERIIDKIIHVFVATIIHFLPRFVNKYYPKN